MLVQVACRLPGATRYNEWTDFFGRPRWGRGWPTYSRRIVSQVNVWRINVPRPKPKPQQPKKPWKEFEELVARIERVLAPVEAIVKSNDWLLNYVTGRKRQVDASIRYKVGTVPGLITVECRKHKDKQDDTWIEQLATKRQNLRADKTIAVSATPVSPQALRTAAQYLIEVRQLSEITEADIQSWLKARNVNHRFFLANLISAYPQVYPIGAGSYSHVAKQDIPDGTQLQTSELYGCPATGQKMKALDLFGLCIPQLQQKIRSAGIATFPVKIQLEVEFGRNRFTFLTRNGARDLGFVTFFTEIRLESQKDAPVDKHYQYSSPDGPLVSVAESHTDFLGMNVVVAFHKEQDSDKVRTSVHMDT